MLEAQDGAKAVGWPAAHESTVQSSPFLYDIDRDGVQDIGLVTFNGEILFFTDTVCTTVIDFQWTHNDMQYIATVKYYCSGVYYTYVLQKASMG